MIKQLSIYQEILNKKAANKKQLAILIDPDKYNSDSLTKLIASTQSQIIDYYFVGGSLISNDMEMCITTIRSHSTKPIVIFPGHYSHISDKADSLLLLSLISGRNPEFLIGNHVIAAPILKKSNLEIISTGYILVENGNTSSVQYMSNTQPIPRTKNDIAIATAIAGEMIGMKLIYLEAGSGAKKSISDQMITAVKSNINVPLIVGGGLRTYEEIQSKFQAGADLIVIGNGIEQNPDLLLKLFELSK
jgi:putative glycerol-1-phosphate prenyltransferase